VIPIDGAGVLTVTTSAASTALNKVLDTCLCNAICRCLACGGTSQLSGNSAVSFTPKGKLCSHHCRMPKGGVQNSSSPHRLRNQQQARQHVGQQVTYPAAAAHSRL
jgi:hypothetical protein